MMVRRGDINPASFDLLAMDCLTSGQRGDFIENGSTQMRNMRGRRQCDEDSRCQIARQVARQLRHCLHASGRSANNNDVMLWNVMLWKKIGFHECSPLPMSPQQGKLSGEVLS